MEKCETYRRQLDGKKAQDAVAWALKEFGPGQVALASSLGAEDQVLTEMIASVDKSAKIFTLDTGRLFQQTYDVMQLSVERYGITYELYGPDPEELAALVKSHGPNLFYQSVELRKACCDVRKTRPLKKALNGLKAWICGLRRDQAVTRAAVDAISWDDDHGLYKICPLFDWTEEAVWAYIRERKVPYNTLHDIGFRSIGCAPCTRAVGPGEDVRAGRWWWESPDKKECGLHRPHPKVG
ncbi:MAG: phosphoadenylyl-sulfate reductase [Elusimicrobia bacterium]|nr:phosphoadenylyl-sulfate reductase [Elusimicrobiota bacterium]